MGMECTANAVDGIKGKRCHAYRWRGGSGMPNNWPEIRGFLVHCLEFVFTILAERAESSVVVMVMDGNPGGASRIYKDRGLPE